MDPTNGTMDLLAMVIRVCGSKEVVRRECFRGWKRMERSGGEELNLKGREDQNGAKLAEKHNMHRRKHERAIGSLNSKAERQRPQSGAGRPLGATAPLWARLPSSFVWWAVHVIG